MSTINESDEKTSSPTPIELILNARIGRRLQFDEHGHIIPPTDEEMQARTEALQVALAEMVSIPDDPPGSDEEFWRAIDAGRPERPLFKELYEP